MGIHEGTVVLNYRLSKELGDGGFGVVYLAEHTELPRRVAVKILHPEYARRAQVVDRFFREARAVCEIGHPAIVDVTNFGRLETGEPFYMMEFVDGQSVSEWTSESGPLSFEQIAQVFGLVADALTAAHDKGIIHRDLKPDNIMLVKRDSRIVDAKLLDFGIAKLISEQDPIKSHTGMAMGTPSYMAPEQARDSKNVDARADVYGFAATVFAALTNRPPFVATNTTDLLIAVATEEAPRLSTVRGGIPPELDNAIAACLAKSVDARPATIADAWGLILRALGYEIAGMGRARMDSQRGIPVVIPAGESGRIPMVAGASPTGTMPAPQFGPHGTVPLGQSSQMIAEADVARAHQLAAPETTLGASGGEVHTAPPGPPRKKRGLLAGILTVGVAGATVAGLMVMTGGDKKKTTGESGAGGDTLSGPAVPGGAIDAGTSVVAAPPIVADAAPAVPDKPKVDCSYRGFKVALKGAKANPQVAVDALARLEQCHTLNLASGRDYEQLKKSLEAAKVPPCDVSSFEKVLAEKDPDTRKAAGAAALKRLEKCRAGKKIGRRDHKKLAKKLAATQKVAVATTTTTTSSGVSARLKRACAEPRFRNVYQASAPSDASIRTALTDLGRCKRAMSSTRYRSTKGRLEEKRRQRSQCSYGNMAAAVRGTRNTSSAVNATRSRVRGCRVYLSSGQHSGLQAELDRKLRPRTNCSSGYFATARSSSNTSTVRAGIARAERCRAEGQLSSGAASGLVRNLQAKLRQLQTPTLDCSESSFARVYGRRNVPKSTVRAARHRLQKCKSKLGNTKYQQIHAALTAKLLE